MDANMLEAAGHALLIILDPMRLAYLFGGVTMGLALGILPGIGGLAGIALLLPFTYNLDPHTAFAILLGLGAASTTADPISAILFGVPGHAASAATTLDGYPLTRQGYAGRALGASYMSALLGGLFGAALLGLTLPVLRPVMLYFGSPELFALAVFGISMVSALSGNTPLRGLTAAAFGILLSMIGTDPQTGTQRWTLDSFYLLDSLPLVPLTLGVFALPELCDLSIARAAAVTDGLKIDTRTGLRMGVRDCFTHWFLILRCSWIGTTMGAVPGIGASIIDWISYGHALRTEKGARETFGHGDVRGVIAAESATNAKEGGALVPTIAFGVPASAGMAILLGAFLIQGLVPGPEMLTRHLDVTYSMVWSIAVANILGSGLCFLFSGQLAKIATLRYTLIMPCVLSLIYIGAFEGTRQWGDLYSLLFFGLVGWGFKHFRWPRPPLVLGFILGKMIERYLFISIERFGADWLLHPLVIVILAMAALSLLRPFFQDVRAHGGIGRMLADFGPPRPTGSDLFPAALLCLFVAMLVQSWHWALTARLVPTIVGFGAVAFCGASLLNHMCARHEPAEVGALVDEEALIGHADKDTQRRMHMDIASHVAHLPTAVKLGRGAVFFGWMGAFLASMATIGLIPTIPVLVISYMRIEGRERWSLVLPMAAVLTLFVWGVFGEVLAIPWPGTLLGAWVPALRVIPSV